MAIVLRQEIHIANVTKRPVELMGDDCGIDDTLEPASDAMWVYRIMLHTAKCTNFAYGNEPRTETLWDHLWQYLDDWEDAKPPSFCPLNHTGGENPVEGSISSSPSMSQQAGRTGRFPILYYVYDRSVASRQYMEICRILLVAHDPRAPSLGLGRAKYIRDQEDKIRQAVRTVCGIWLSNPEYTPARALAGLAIGMAGELFTNALETTQLLEIITEAESHVGWPCLKISPRLKSFWEMEGVHN